MMRSFYKINLSPQSVMSTKNVKLNNWVILSVFPINWEPGIIDLCNTLIILVIMINFHLLCSAALQRWGVQHMQLTSTFPGCQNSHLLNGVSKNDELSSFILIFAI